MIHIVIYTTVSGPVSDFFFFNAVIVILIVLVVLIITVYIQTSVSDSLTD